MYISARKKGMEGSSQLLGLQGSREGVTRRRKGRNPISLKKSSVFRQREKNVCLQRRISGGVLKRYEKGRTEGR